MIFGNFFRQEKKWYIFKFWHLFKYILINIREFFHLILSKNDGMVISLKTARRHRKKNRC